jgi:hypothetical protein
LQLQFLEVDWFNLCITIEFADYLSDRDRQIIDELFNSWFLLGKLGGFNAENLQVQDAGVDISYLDYDINQWDNSMMSLMHNMGEVEYEGKTAKCWFDLGTADAISLDILLNCLRQLDKEYIPIEKVIVGGSQSPEASQD